MKNSVKNLSETRVQVTITAEPADLEQASQTALRQISKTVKVPGFRKGRAPIEVAKKHIDPTALGQESLENAVNQLIAQAFIKNDLRVLERPEVEIKKYVPDQQLEFTAEADILPKVKLANYKNLTYKRPVAKVSAADVKEVIERIQKGFAEKEAVKTAAKDGDEVVIDFVGKLDGEAFEGGTSQDYALTLGSKSFIPGFEEALIGLKAGDKKDVELTFPADYHAANLAGQKVIFEVNLKTVNALKLPAVDDELAAKAGPFKTVRELQADIKREMLAQQERENDDKVKDELIQQLVSKSKVGIPAVLREDQIKSIEQDLVQNLQYQGMSLEQYYQSHGLKDRDAWVKAEATEAADNRVKAGLVLAELSRELKIEATDEEIAEQVNNYRERYKNNPDMAKHFEQQEAQREVANRLITEKTINKLVEINR